jgi:hypothetical protein
MMSTIRLSVDAWRLTLPGGLINIKQRFGANPERRERPEMTHPH